MVMLYVAGKPVGPLADALLVELAAQNKRVEFRDAAGKPLGTFTPNEPANGHPVPWDPTITEEELQLRETRPGLTFEEVKKRLGWE